MAACNEVKAQAAKEIQLLTEECLNKLKLIWDETFETEICEDNMRKITEHVSIFYSEVIEESLTRQERIKEEIEKLREEANYLQRLLKVDISLTPQKGVPLYTVQMRLDEKLEELRECLKRRKQQIYELLLEQATLCEELGETPRPLLDDPLPSEEELNDFQVHLNNLKLEKMNRLSEVSTLRRDIKHFLTELELQVQNEEEERLLNDRNIPLTKININRLRGLREDYLKQLNEIRESIETMKKKLENLWNCLETSPSVREKFGKYKDYSQTTYDKFYRELDRCETQKRQNIKRFVDKIRDEIIIWWDKTLKSDIERSRFSGFTNDCYTEDLLALHEMELEDLKSFYHENEKIFELISERNLLWERMGALEAKALEPGRYNNRGGQLLKEEKERKTIANKLPKIEAQLKELVEEYEIQHKRKFLVYGEDILELIERDWEKKRSEKEKMMSARKIGVITPLSRTISRTPSSKSNQVTSSIKKAPSSTNISSVPSTTKRKMAKDEYLAPNAKRNLITDLNSPGTFLKPNAVNKTPHKSPLKKPKLIATTIQRRSGRLSGTRTRRKSNKMRNIAPKIVVTNENSLASESFSYDNFEEHIEKDPACRSSILNENGQREVRTRNQRKAAGRLPNPRIISVTPTKVNHSQFSIRKSPGLSRTGSPMAGPSSRKLTTKNLPIII